MSAPTRCLLLYLALAAVALLAYTPALFGDWLWDDVDWIRDNEALRSWSGLWQIWFEPGAVIQYYPLTYTTWWIDYHVWGLAPMALHVENVLLHAANALLFGLLLRRMELPGAAAAALIFLLHPVHAESVAWMVERKNVLSAAFYLGACHLWCVYLRERSVRMLLIALGCFALALLAKTATLMLPFTLLAISWWRDRRVSLLVRPLLPFVALSLTFALVTVVRERGEGAVGFDWALTFTERIALLGQVVGAYLSKLLLPFGLSFSYPKWQIGVDTLTGWLPTLSLLGAFAAACYLRWIGAVAVACALCVYVANLLPVSGLVDYYYLRYAFTADHFQYLSSFGAIALFCCGVANLLRAKPRHVTAVIAIVGALALGGATFARATSYRDVEILWRDTIEATPQAWLAHTNLGHLLDSRDGVGAGLEHHRRAVEVYPYAFESNNAIGNYEARQGDFDAARVHFDAALKARPTDPLTYNNLGAMFGMYGDYAGAREWLEYGHQQAPTNRELLRNLVVVLSQVPDAAVRDPERALRLARALVSLGEPSMLDEHALFRAVLLAGSPAEAAVIGRRVAARAMRESEHRIAEQVVKQLKRLEAR